MGRAMMGVTFLILLILYLITIRSISRQATNPTCLFLYTFFFIVAIGIAKDQSMARPRAEAGPTKQTVSGNFFKVG